MPSNSGGKNEIMKPAQLFYHLMCGHQVPIEDQGKTLEMDYKFTPLPHIKLPTGEELAQHGWICPRCEKVNAPARLECDCKPEGE